MVIYKKTSPIDFTVLPLLQRFLHVTKKLLLLLKYILTKPLKPKGFYFVAEHQSDDPRVTFASIKCNITTKYHPSITDGNTSQNHKKTDG